MGRGVKKEDNNLENLGVAITEVKEVLRSLVSSSSKGQVVADYRVSNWLAIYKVLVKAYGQDSDEWELSDYIERRKLDYINRSGEITQDRLYGFIKEVESYKDYMELSVDFTESKFTAEELETVEGLRTLLELLSGVFNNWEEFDTGVNSELSVREEVKDEFTYEELVERGVTPDYDLEDKEEKKVMSRVERRRRS